MRIGYADPSYFGCAYGMAIRWAKIYRGRMWPTLTLTLMTSQC